MKKTKVVIPALGIIAFATAASITGTVAWFTASRSVTITAGEFAVINTKDNLALTMASGIATTANNEAKTITVANAAGDTALLTDGTVDHTTLHASPAKPTIIAPDASGNNVGKIVSYDAATANDNTLTGIKRGSFTEAGTTYNVYTAFTWDMTFTVSFAGSQDKKVGLYLDLSQETWAHEVYKAVGASESSTGFYTDAACTTAVEAATLTQGSTYYKKAPDDTGKAFRIAFIPKTVNTDSMGYSKIWAPHQDAAKCSFIDCDKPAAYANSTAYEANQEVYYNNAVYKAKADFTSSTAELDPTKWDAVTLASKAQALASATKTTSLTGSDVSATWDEATVGAGKVLMPNGLTTGVPADAFESSSEALSGKANYLGYFDPKPNDTVSMTFTCVAYYEGTDENITAEASTIYEKMTVSLRFGVATLTD